MADILLRNIPATSVYLREHMGHAVNAAVSFAGQHEGKPTSGIRRGAIMRYRVGHTECVIYVYATRGGSLVVRFSEDTYNG